MWLSDLVAPVPTSDGDDRELGEDDGTTDGSCHFLGAFHSQTNVAVEVTNGNERLETGQHEATAVYQV